MGEVVGAGTAGGGRSLFDLLAAELEPRLRDEFTRRFGEHVDTLIADGRARIDAAVAETGRRVEDAVTRVVVTAPVQDPAEVDRKADARQRSWRTLVQGAVATVIVAVGGGVGQAVASPGFDLFSTTSLQTAGAAGATAALAAILSYVQRLVQPPKE